MIVTAALPWFNEKISDLEQCVRSLANIADRLVALDGAYVRYPGAKPRSPIGQANAIRRAAEAIGIGCEVVQPDELWPGQIAKRSRLLELASVDSDWICTLDADQIIHTDREAARKFLEETTADTVEVTYYTPPDKSRAPEQRSAGVWHEQMAGVRNAVYQFYRVYPEMKVERFHWWYSAVKDGQRVWLQSGDGSRPTVPHAAMPVPYEVEHRTLFRSKEQVLNSRAFCNDREMVVKLTGQEDHRPGLPPPIYDFERMPW